MRRGESEFSNISLTLPATTVNHNMYESRFAVTTIFLYTTCEKSTRLYTVYSVLGIIVLCSWNRCTISTECYMCAPKPIAAWGGQEEQGVREVA